MIHRIWLGCERGRVASRGAFPSGPRPHPLVYHLRRRSHAPGDDPFPLGPSLSCATQDRPRPTGRFDCNDGSPSAKLRGTARTTRPTWERGASLRVNVLGRSETTAGPWRPEPSTPV